MHHTMYSYKHSLETLSIYLRVGSCSTAGVLLVTPLLTNETLYSVPGMRPVIVYSIKLLDILHANISTINTCNLFETGQTGSMLIL